MGTKKSEVYFKRYLRSVLDGDHEAARQVVDEALVAGLRTRDLLLEVLAPTQQELGERWHRGEINIAQEHWATEVTREMMQVARNRGAKPPALGVSAVIACIAGEPHGLAGRMFADLLSARGWHIDYLGTAVPPADLISYLAHRKPHLVGISVTLEAMLRPVEEICLKIRQLEDPPQILLGGAAASAAKPELLAVVDAVATHADEGIELAEQLVGLGERDLARYLRTVGRRIASLRQDAGLSQSRLAERAKVTRPYLSAVEQGRQNISLEIALRLAVALQLPMQQLLSEDPAC